MPDRSVPVKKIRTKVGLESLAKRILIAREAKKTRDISPVRMLGRSSASSFLSSLTVVTLCKRLALSPRSVLHFLHASEIVTIIAARCALLAFGAG
jgi:hypothetical protein